METPLILTLDLGTSSVRALLFDGRGRHLEGMQASREHIPRTTPDGGAELDADELVERALACAEEVLQRAGKWQREIAGVAVCTFWHSFLGVDGAGQAVTPIYLWADTRSAREVAELRTRLDERAVHARTGCVFHTSYLPARLLWVQRTFPDLSRRVRRWLSPGEYLFLRLFGEPRCSYSMASGTGLFDQNRLDWDEEVLSAAKVRREQLSPLVDVDAPAKGLRGKFAARLQPLRKVPWFPAVGDGACSNLGCGCVSPKRAALMIGTSGAMRVLFTSGQARPPWGVWCYRVDRRRFLLGGALSNGGNLLVWMQNTFRLEPEERVEQELATLEPDAHGLTVLPFLAGERSPGWAPEARAAIVGLRWHTRPIDILQAGLEAVAYRFALLHELLRSAGSEVREIIATGGALLRLPVWIQILADVLGQPVTASAEPEASSRGAALLALEALGVLPDLREVPAALGKTYWPNPESQARYQQAKERQRELYSRLIGD